MKTIVIALIAGAALYSGVSSAACTYPTAPTAIPNGETATQEQMLAAKKEISKYNDDMTAYLSCLDLEHDQRLADMEKEAAGKTSDEDKKAFEAQKEEYARQQIQKHNAAVDEVSAVVERFNQQLRAYKKKHS